MSTTSATVETLTAEVRVLMVGNRQVTLSVYRQLDLVQTDEIEPFGRVRDSADGKHGPGVYVVGRAAGGALVRAYMCPPESPQDWSKQLFPDSEDSSFVVGPRGASPDGEFRYRASRALVGSRQIPGVGRYDHVMEISLRAPEDPAMKPGTWRYASAEAQACLEDEACCFLDEIEEEHASYAKWKNLPLIVLAGLR